MRERERVANGVGSARFAQRERCPPWCRGSQRYACCQHHDAMSHAHGFRFAQRWHSCLRELQLTRLTHDAALARRSSLAPGDRNPTRQLGLHLQLVRFGSIRVKRPRNSTRGHPRGKHLVYVMGTGNRTTRCKKRGSNWAASRRENGQKPCKKPYDRLFWRRFEPIGPPQRRTSFNMWPRTI